MKKPSSEIRDYLLVNILLVIWNHNWRNQHLHFRGLKKVSVWTIGKQKNLADWVLKVGDTPLSIFIAVCTIPYNQCMWNLVWIRYILNPFFVFTL